MIYDRRLFVSHPKLSQGLFSFSVIYVYQHDSSGSLGLILNKTSKSTVKSFMEKRKLAWEGSEKIHLGGPLNERAVLMLHEQEWTTQNTTPIGLGLSLSSDDYMLEKMSTRMAPDNWRMFFGYCAWGPGQLEREVFAPYGWQITDIRFVEDFFMYDGKEQWEYSLASCGKTVLDTCFE